MAINFKKLLLTGTALVAVGYAAQAHAATEITGANITATDATGLVESTGTTTVVVDSNLGAIVLGANGTPSLTMNSSGNTLTVNIDRGASANGVTFADNIVETAGDILINVVDDNVTFKGNVSNSLITAGSASADPTILLTVDTANAENITFAAPIVAVDATDVINMKVTNTQGGANTVAFTGAIGGTTAATAVDTITLGADTTDPLDVTFGADVNAGAITIGTGNGANAVTNLRFGTAAATSSVTGVISGAGAADTNNINIVGGSTVTFNSAITGANIDAIKVGANATDTTLTVKAGIASGAITLGGAGAAGADDTILNVNTAGGAFTITPGIDGGAAAGTQKIAVSGGNVATVTGAIGAGGAGFIDEVSLSGTGTGLTTGGALTATDVIVGAGTTLTAGGTVTASGGVKISGAAGTVALGDDIDVTGTIDNTSGTNGVGVLTLADAAGGGNSVISGNVGATNSLASITLNGAGIGQFTGLVKATTTTVNSAGTIQLNGAGANVTNAVIAATGGTLSLGAGANLTGGVTTTAGNNTGTLTLVGASTISGAVGASGAALTAVNTGANATASTFSGAVNATTITNTGSGTTNFDGAVTATSVTFGGAGTVNFNQGLTGAVDFANKAATVAVASGKTITGAIDSTVGGAASVLTLSGGTQVIAGAVGTTNAIGTVNAGQAGGATTFSSTVNAGTLSVGTGSVTLNNNLTGNLTFASDGTGTIAATKGVTGAVAGTGGNKGSLTFLGNGSVSSTLGTGGNFLKALTLSGTGTTVTAGNTIAANTTTVAGNTLAVTGTFGIGAGQTLKASLTGATTNGKVTSTGVATVNADSVITISVDTTAYIANNAQFTIIDGNVGGGAVATLNPGKLTDDSAILTFTQVANADDLVIKATRTAINTVATSGNTQSAGTVLDSAALTGSADATIQKVLGNVSGAANATELDSVLTSVAPTVDGGATTAVLDANVTVQGINETRLAFLRTGDGQSGMAAGDGTDGAGMWVQIHGQVADQDRRDGIAGYDSDSIGGVIGFDTDRISADTKLGLALSYTFTNVDSNNANTTETDIGSYGLTVYGSRDLGDDMFVDAQLGYAYNSIDTERHNVGGAGVTADGDFHSSQYSAKVSVGRDYATEPGMLVTPTASVGYSLLDTSTYTETGAGGANLHVASDDVSSLDLGLGVNASWKLKVGQDGAILKPSVHAGATYDVLGNNVETTANFTAGGVAFRTDGFDPAQLSGNVGAGLNYSAGENWDLSAVYDYEVKSDYDAHSGYLRATTHF